MKWDEELNVLIELLKQNPGVKTVRIVSTEGLPIGSALPKEVDETRISAMIAALLSLSEKSVTEMKRGEFDQLYVKGSDGYLLILRAGPNAVLTVSTTKDVRLGLSFLDYKRTCEKIGKIFSGDFDDKDDKNGSK